MAKVRIVEVDPRGVDALALLREAAIEARELYPELHRSDAAWPANPPTPERGIYLIAYADGAPAACGALRPLVDNVVEVRRIFVTKRARRRGLGRRILEALEAAARRMNYGVMRLETGNRQIAAIGLYLESGFARIEPFGEYANDPTSVCFEKSVRSSGESA